MAYATVTLSGTYQTPDGTPHKGHVEIIPSERVIKDTTGNVILTGRVKVDLDAQGAFTVALPATDDETLNPSGFGYTIAAKLHSSHPPAVSFSLPASLGATTVEDLTPVDPATFEATATYADASTVTALDSRVTTVETTKANSADLATVATTGNYTDLQGQPTVPSTAADIGAEPAGLSQGTHDTLDTNYGTLRQRAVAAGKRLHAATTGNRSETATVTVGTLVPYATASTVPNPTLTNAWDSTANSVRASIRILGSRAVASGNNIKPDPSIITYTPGPLTVAPFYAETEYQGTKIDILIRNNLSGGAPHRIYVDGRLAATVLDTDLTAIGVNPGYTARLPLTFPDIRTRRIGYIQETSVEQFVGYTINSAHPLAYPATISKGPRVLISGDSYTEGTGAGANGYSFARWLGWHMGWLDLWRAGSGSTGYVTDGTRTALVDRYVNDIVNQAPNIVLIATGYNDSATYTTDPQAVLNAAATIYDGVIAGLPNAEVIVVGPWAPRGTEWMGASFMSMDAELEKLAVARGLRYISPAQEEWITGNGKVGSPAGNGNADVYISSDGTHPSPEGHEYLSWRLAGHLAVPYVPD